MLILKWKALGVNLNGFGDAFSRAPAAYTIFLGTLFAFELLLMQYFINLNIFEVMGYTAILGIIGFFSGRAVLTETQARRKAGQR